MKRLLVICSLITIHYSLLAQQDSGFTNKAEAKNQMVDGKKEGKWVEYWEFGEEPYITKDTTAPMYSLIFYKANRAYGISRCYLKSGKLLNEIHYTDNKDNYTVKVFYESGKLRGEAVYENSKQVGAAKNYDENGNEIK
jgi:antitoxin component YwqK of YwqJK toxin-antitoxin module